jgi:transposase
MRPKGSADVLADRRRKALALVDDGLSLNEAARRLGCPASSVMRWRDQRDKEGDSVFTVRASPGRPSRLNDRQKKAIGSIILKGAIAAGYRTELWTTSRVAEVIEKRFGISYDRNHVGRILHAIGLSCQKPDRRALERNEERIEQWKSEEWPRIKKTPKTWGRTSSS